MRTIVCAAFLVVIALRAWAADQPKPNTLLSEEIADGWLLLFDGATTFGWKIDGEAKVEKGVLILGATKATTAVLTAQFGYWVLRFNRLTDDAQSAKLTFNAYKQGPFGHVAPPQEKG